jgi:hypothetical protein
MAYLIDSCPWRTGKRAVQNSRRNTGSEKSVVRALIFFVCLFAQAAGFAFGAIARDVTVSQDGGSASATIVSPVFTTSAGSEELLAFVSTDYITGANTTVKSVTGGGLTWTLIKRANAQSGSAEIWGAFSAVSLSGVSVTATLSQSVVSSMTVMSFSGVNAAGAIGASAGKSAATGAPTASLVTTAANSWVLGVGNDYTNAVARTLGTGQSLIHQYLTSTGDTYWVQMQAGPIVASGTTVTINDTAPTTDQYNLSIVELLAASSGSGSYSVSGTISPAAIGSGTTVTLGGSASASTVADANGNYSFTGLANGSYTLTPGKTGYTFTPATASVTVNGANQTGVNFTAQAVATWSISGTISPVTGGAGATVTLSGASSATTVTDANGNYTFAGLASGSYTVTPTESGYSFTPASKPVTVSGANQTAVNFTAQAANSWSISGTIGGAGCSGCSFVQSTHSSQGGHTDWPTLLNVKAGDALVYIGEFSNWTPGATVNMTDSHGNTWYRCDNNATSNFVEIQDQTTNGMSCQYTVNTAAWPTITAQPVSSQCVSTSCTQVGGSFFELALPPSATASAWAAPYAGTSTSGSNNVNCGSIALTQANDFLMCDFDNASGTPTAGTSPVSFKMDETIVTAIETGLYPGSGTITPTGTLNASGIAYTSIAVAFGAATGGGGGGATVTLSGASSASTVADANGNYSFTGLANGSYAVTPSKSGYTFTPASRAVTVNGANQTAVNFTAQAVTSWSISGTISPTAGGAGATVMLGGTASASTVADTNGNYSFAGLANGSYSITPGKTGYTFTPATASVTVNGANQTGVNFTVQAVATWSISGTISPVAGGASATVKLSGASSASTVADANGNYSFAGLANGSYVVAPSESGYTFTPASQPVTLNGASQTGINFTAQPAPTYSISGVISPSASGSGATVSLSGASSGSTTADVNGNYTFSQLANGAYTITPSKAGLTFTPASQSVTLNGANAANINFTAATQSPTITRDITVSQDGGSASATITSPVFTTSTANEQLLALISTDYLTGANTTVKSVVGGGLTWALIKRTNAQSGSAEIWGAFAAVPLSGVSVTATLSQSVISSMTVMSFSGVNPAGAVGATVGTSAATGAPTASLVTTAANSLVLGVGNDFTNAIARTLGTGQTLIHQYLTPTGDTYWVQILASPVATSGTAVTINDTAPTKDQYNLSVVELLSGRSGSAPTPPTVSMASPAQGATMAGLVGLTALASDAVAVVGVQFLLDGAPLGAELTSAPYFLAWDSTTVAAGPHTLAARAVNGDGLSTTSSAVTITVASPTNTAVVGQWSSAVTLPAVAVNLILLQNNQVLFYQDGATPTVWNYVQNTFTSVPESADLFCSGHALLSDGRVLVVGGYGESSNTIGLANAEIFDPVGQTWTSIPNMRYPRWYPNATTLSDGRILVTAGWQTTAHSNAGISEIYDPVANSWSSLTNANNPFETYPFLYLLPDGRVIHIGGSEYATDTDVLDLSTVSWSVIDPNIVDGGSATMYTPNKFVKAGSASDSQNVGPSSNTTFVLDMTQPTPAWVETPSMVYPRSFMNLTMLPDGTALATGGETDRNGGDIANAVYAAELWSPLTQTWSTMASMHTPREYHGTALLLPDGRVLESGMGADFGNVPNEQSAEFYSPPYLFKGARPTISQAPTQIQYNSTFFVGTPNAASIASVVLIRSGAVTHFFDQNERYVPLSFTQASGGLTVTTPVDANLAPPGFYMLFIVNTAGVPSIAPFVQLP